MRLIVSTKAANEKKKHGSMRSKMDRALDKKKRGKFDARFLSSSSEEAEGSMEEEEVRVKKKRKKNKLLGKRNRTPQKSASAGLK